MLPVTAVELLSLVPSEAGAVEAGVLAEGFASTTTALLALSLWHRGEGDTAGADLLAEFAGRFAEYEVTTL